MWCTIGINGRTSYLGSHSPGLCLQGFRPTWNTNLLKFRLGLRIYGLGFRGSRKFGNKPWKSDVWISSTRRQKHSTPRKHPLLMCLATIGFRRIKVLRLSRNLVPCQAAISILCPKPACSAIGKRPRTSRVE